MAIESMRSKELVILQAIEVGATLALRLVGFNDAKRRKQCLSSADQAVDRQRAGATEDDRQRH